MVSQCILVEIYVIQMIQMIRIGRILRTPLVENMWNNIILTY